MPRSPLPPKGDRPPRPLGRSPRAFKAPTGSVLSPVCFAQGAARGALAADGARFPARGARGARRRRRSCGRAAYAGLGAREHGDEGRLLLPDDRDDFIQGEMAGSPARSGRRNDAADGSRIATERAGDIRQGRTGGSTTGAVPDRAGPGCRRAPVLAPSRTAAAARRSADRHHLPRGRRRLPARGGAADENA